MIATPCARSRHPCCERTSTRADRRMLRRLDGELSRRWRRAAQADAASTLAALQARTGAAPLRRVDSRPGALGVVVTLEWTDGLVVHLAPCHPAAVDLVAAAVDCGHPVALRRAARHGALWSLDLDAGGGHLALLARSAAMAGGGGGASDPRRRRPLAAV